MPKKCLYEGCNKQSYFNVPTEKNGIYCFEHKKENMINVKDKHCIEKGCNKQSYFNVPTEKTGIYCSEHKKENMINVKLKRCVEDGCVKNPSFNYPTEKTGAYCLEHKKENMINIKSKRCQTEKCKEDAIYGINGKKPQFCFTHKKEGMINIILDNKCCILDCENDYEFIGSNNEKFCLKHSDKSIEISIKRLCKYCDIEQNSKYICNSCKQISSKKEWSIVRYLRKTIDTKFEYNTCKMLQGCSKKRPDIYFELNSHCLIVEIDENQHKTYEDSCECARINEIVNGIGGKSVIIIRFNPDTTKHKGKKLPLLLSDKIKLLVNTIKEELTKEYDSFLVKLIQIYYDDDYKIYKDIKEEIITDIVCI